MSIAEPKKRKDIWFWYSRKNNNINLELEKKIKLQNTPNVNQVILQEKNWQNNKKYDTCK